MNMPLIGIDPSHDVCNAREHGLVGNGRVNDQPSLAALVEKLGHECAADGRPRVLYCPPGEYLLCDVPTIWKSGVSLIGAGPGATRFLLQGKDQPVSLARFIEQMDGASPQYPLRDCMFASFEIDGSRVELTKYNPRAKGLDLQYMIRAMFRDLYIHDTAATGLGCDHLQDSTIQGVIAERCGRANNGREPGGAGLGIGIGGWGQIERLDIMDCIAVGNARHGIFVELQQGMKVRPRGIKIAACHCVDNRYGISDWGAEGLVASTCVLCENHEVGFDVSAEGTSEIAGRGGLVADCVIDGNGRDGVSIGNTHGAYTVRASRISHNGRYGYYQHNIKDDPEPSREIAIDSNDIYKNGLDGIHVGAPMTDPTIANNRIRNNGRRTGGAARGEGAGVTYAATSVKDASAHWASDAHKGKKVVAAGMEALVAANSEQELHLFPHKPGAKSAWEKGPPPPGTLYLMVEEAPPVRPGIGVASKVDGAWIRSNRIWDNQERRTQNEDLATHDGGELNSVPGT
jgi:parallel beta-helix repeat protein